MQGDLVALNLLADLVYDGGDVRIPVGFNKPRLDQLLGTAAEQLCELAGRTCYDSLGTGRGSIKFHQHLLEVKHLSVYEHFNLTIGFDEPYHEYFSELVNRPGVTCVAAEQLRVTANLRSALEWDQWGIRPGTVGRVGQTLRAAMSEAVPTILPPSANPVTFSQLTPSYDNERWISLFLRMGRTGSHEQVRHGDFSAISQRSTRYCDESLSPWVTHPLLAKTLLELPAFVTEPIRQRYQAHQDNARVLYRDLTEVCSLQLATQGNCDRLTAQKQSRGAARGVLGNSLQTEMIFSANVAQWRRMLHQRLHPAADAEIRALYARILDTLHICRYANCFSDLSTKPSPDGLGVVLV